MKACVAVVAALILASCTRSEPAEERVLVIQVDGMQRGDGGKT